MVVTLEIIYSLCEEIGLMLSLFFNPIQDKPFWGCSRIGGVQKGFHFLKPVIYLTKMRFRLT